MSVISQSNPNTPSITITNADGSITVLPGSPLAPFTNYPVLGTRMSKDNFKRKNLDRTVVNETDGGYEYTRPLNRNFKKRDYDAGYSLLPDADMILLRNFQEAVGNCSGLFIWTDPTTFESCLCRLTDTLNEVYAGYGTTHVWNVAFKLRVMRVLSATYEGYISAIPSGSAVGGYFSSLAVSVPIVTSTMGYFVFINGDLQRLNDTTITNNGSTIQLNNGVRVTTGDNLIVFAYSLTSTRVLNPVVTTSGLPDGSGNYTQLTLNVALPPTVYESTFFIRGVAQDPNNISLSPDGLTATLLNGVKVTPSDDVRVVGYILPGKCAVTGAVDGSNKVFTIAPGKNTYLMVFCGGLLLDPASMYTVTGAANDTLTLSFAPSPGDTIRVYTW